MSKITRRQALAALGALPAIAAGSLPVGISPPMEYFDTRELLPVGRESAELTKSKQIAVRLYEVWPGRLYGEVDLDFASSNVVEFEMFQAREPRLIYRASSRG